MLIEPTNSLSFGPDRSRPILSVIVPCFNEELNLPLLYERVRTVLDAERIDWEMIAVDDHSRDGTFQVATISPGGIVGFGRFGSRVMLDPISR